WAALTASARATASACGSGPPRAPGWSSRPGARSNAGCAQVARVGRTQARISAQAADREERRACVRLTREIFAQPAFDRFRGREIQPGAGVETDEQIDAFIRDKAESAFHPSSTCRMGRVTDPRAVVDPQLRVIGVEALRVVDSSIMPSITTGNLNAPTIMLAEKAADHIRGAA